MSLFFCRGTIFPYPRPRATCLAWLGSYSLNQCVRNVSHGHYVIGSCSAGLE